MDGGSTAGKPIHCKAAVIWAPGEKYKIQTVVVAPPKQDQVRVKILYVSICQTDVTIGKMKELAPLFPFIPGHEAAGVIESVGEGVTNIQVGDHVLPVMQGQCGACSHCKTGRTNNCKELPLKTVSPTLVPSDEPHFTTEDGRVINIFFNLSTFSEYIVVHKDNVAKMSPDAPLEKLCVLPCGVGTGIGTAWNVAKVTPGSTVAVFGLGTVGLAVVQACKISGASRIIGVDINPNKFQKAKDLGVTDGINPKDHDKSISAVILKLTGGGVDFSFECVGVTDLMKEAVLSTMQEFGMTVIVGVPSSPRAEFQINVYDFLHGKTVCGTMLGGLTVRDLTAIAKRCINKEFQLEPYITHNLPFSQINEAMEIFHSGECLRCVLQMGV
ncbi:unnamed protein product [Calypogeia fissa]